MKNNISLECRVCRKRFIKSALNDFNICLDCADDIEKTTRSELLPESFSVYKTIGLLDKYISTSCYGQNGMYGLCTDGEHNYIFNYQWGNAGEGMFIIQCDINSVTKDNVKELFYAGREELHKAGKSTSVELSREELNNFHASLFPNFHKR